jgi:hypothetical protein
MEELDYRPNAIARSLSRGRAMTFGVIVPFFVRPSAVERLRVAEAEFTAAGYDTVLYNVAAPEQVGAQFVNVGGGRADGVLVISVPPPAPQIERLIASKTPVVLVDVRYPELREKCFPRIRYPLPSPPRKREGKKGPDVGGRPDSLRPSELLLPGAPNVTLRKGGENPFPPHVLSPVSDPGVRQRAAEHHSAMDALPHPAPQHYRG